MIVHTTVVRDASHKGESKEKEHDKVRARPDVTHSHKKQNTKERQSKEWKSSPLIMIFHTTNEQK